MSSVNKAHEQAACLYLDGKSIPDIAVIMSIPRSRVRSILIKFGVKLRDRADGVRMAAKKIGDKSRGKKRQDFSDEWKNNIRKARQEWGENNSNGISLKQNGYWEITRGVNKGKSLHVAIMEARIGRRLLGDECVHHIDGNKQNNNENNLALMTRGGHARHHRMLDKMENSNVHN